MGTLEVLIAARAEVEKGWCKHMAYDYDGNVCALGAIDVALGVKPKPCSARLWDPPGFNNAMAALERVVGQAIPIWNDDPSTTKADVLNLYDRAINAEAQKVAGNPDPAHVHSQAA